MRRTLVFIATLLFSISLFVDALTPRAATASPSSECRSALRREAREADQSRADAVEQSVGSLEQCSSKSEWISAAQQYKRRLIDRSHYSLTGYLRYKCFLAARNVPSAFENAASACKRTSVTTTSAQRYGDQDLAIQQNTVCNSVLDQVEASAVGAPFATEDTIESATQEAVAKIDSPRIGPGGIELDRVRSTYIIQAGASLKSLTIASDGKKWGAALDQLFLACLRSYG